VEGEARPASVIVTGNSNSLYGLAFYITHNFGQFIRLAWLKTVAFFGLTRGYYSRWHNAGLVLIFYPIQVAAIAGIGWWFRQHLKKWLFLVSVLLMTWITVVMTCDDWHNRFYLNIVPFLILLSLPAVHWVVRRGRWPAPSNG
jgi:hypothetical protein